MQNEKDDIERLFSKKFEKFEVKTSEEEWLNISSKLSRSNFLKFSFTTFNIYFLLVLVTFAGTATFTGIRNSQLSKKIYKLERTIQSYQSKEHVHPASTFTDSANIQLAQPELKTDVKTVEFQKESNPKSIPEIKSQTDKPKIKDVPLSSSEFEIKDTAQKVVINPSIRDTVQRTIVRKVKKTFVIKPKTVVVKDTIVITKSLKMKF